MLLHEKVAQRYLSARTMRLYHGTTVKAAESILQHGFDLHRVKPRWVNDYAVSTLTNPKAVQRYFGDSPGKVVLEMTFRGNMSTVEEVQIAAGLERRPEDYTRAVIKAGIDAVLLDGTGARQVFVYNVKALSDIHVWSPPREILATSCITVTGGDRTEYLDDVWQMYQKTYREIGMHLSSPSEMMHYDHWNLCIGSEGHPVSFGLYESTNFGKKATLSGHDGSAEGKSQAVMNLRTQFKRAGVYGEVSHKVRAIVLAAGSPVVCGAYVEGILRKPVQVLPDGINYTRNLKGVGQVTKTMVGIPKGIPTTDSHNPSCPVEGVTASLEEDDLEADRAGLDAHYSCLALSLI